MISSVVLTSYRDNKSASDTSVELFTKKRKATRLSPDASINYYEFSVKSDYKLFRPKIIINGFEIFDLTCGESDGSLYKYNSELISSKSFLGFNLGVFEALLSAGAEVIHLSTIVNRLGKIKEQKIQFMYEKVASSDFFYLYISRFNRANTYAVEDRDNKNNYVWMTIAIANEFLSELNSFISGELCFTNRVTKSNFITKSRRSLKVDNQGIDWLISNPNELYMSADGEISFSGFNYGINNIQSSEMTEDFDTYENRLLATTLYSVKSKLSLLVLEYEETKLFPHKSVEKLINDADNYLSYIQTTLSLKPPFDTFPEYSNKYLNDFRYVKIFESVVRWYAESNVKYGNEIITSILGLTKIFEHYCFIVLIECFKDMGFSLDASEFKRVDTVSEVKLTRNDEVIELYYEPYIHTTTISPVITSKKKGHYNPDFVLTYSNGIKVIKGIIDAKFAEKQTVISKLGPEIYYKYGLFTHSSEESPLDFVFAMSPSHDDKCEYESARGDSYSNQIKPFLGCFTVPFSEQAMPEVIVFLKNNISDFLH